MSFTNLSNIGHSFPFKFDDPPFSYSWVGFTSLAIIVSYGAFVALKPDPYASIPAVGDTDASILSVYSASQKFYNHVPDLLAEGYKKYKGRAFRFLDKDRRWNVVLTKPEQLDDMRKAPDNVLSFKEFTNETVFLKHIMGRSLVDNEYHVNIIRFQLTRNIAQLYDGLRDEIEVAFKDNIPLTDDWTPIHSYPKFLQIVARATNRIFIGLPICRDKEYLRVNLEFTHTINKCRQTLVRVPAFLRPLVGRYMTTMSQSTEVVKKILGPLIEERLKKIEEYGPEYPDRPADLLSWILEVATGDELSIQNVSNRFLGLNFAALNTASMSFVHALYHLAAEPHYLKPLREEIEAVIAEEGWTKVALTKMHKLDSFLKESQRYNGTSYVSMARLALKDFTFSDGTFVPKGTFVLAAAQPIHYDEENYQDSHKFDGFRFAEIRNQDGLKATNQFINTSLDYLAFGHGKNACPGRFFVASELKTMMAYLVLNYDVKMENEGVRPPNMPIAMSCMPDLSAKVLFRRRQT